MATCTSECLQPGTSAASGDKVVDVHECVESTLADVDGIDVCGWMVILLVVK